MIILNLSNTKFVIRYNQRVNIDRAFIATFVLLYSMFCLASIALKSSTKSEVV